MTNPISARRLLTDEERFFCQLYVGLGGADTHGAASKAYRRAFPHEDPKAATKASARLLQDDLIARYIEEIQQPATMAASERLYDQVRFAADDQQALKASEQVMRLEEKLNQQSAAERHAEILCEIGAEVVVPLPAKCSHCGEGLEVVVPVKEMFKGGSPQN